MLCRCGTVPISHSNQNYILEATGCSFAVARQHIMSQVEEISEHRKNSAINVRGAFPLFNVLCTKYMAYKKTHL